MSSVTLHHGDCLDILPTLEAGSVNAVITDPPYGIGFTYNNHDDSPDGYGEWLWSILEEAERKTTDGGPIFVWQAMPNIRKFSEWFPRDWRIFAACKNFVQMRPTTMQYAFDPVVVWWRDGEQWSAKTASRDFVVSDTSPARRRPGSLDYVEGHPCPRPLGLMRHILQLWVRTGDTILDPFMGSGTTGVAAVQTGRNFIGIEIDEDYYNIAEKRIYDAMMQPRLVA